MSGMKPFQPVHVVTIVIAVALAAVLTPISVHAAGTLVNIADPSNSARKARVTQDGTLTVETRAGSIANSFNMYGSRLGFGWVNLASVTAPTRIAVTELTVTGQGSAGTQEFLIEAFVRTSGTNACTGPGTPGYTRHTLRRLTVPNGSQVQLLFNGPPMVLPKGATGQPTCFGITVFNGPGGSATYAGGIAYRFS